MCSGQAAERTAGCLGEVVEVEGMEGGGRCVGSGGGGRWLWTNGSPAASAKGHME